LNSGCREKTVDYRPTFDDEDADADKKTPPKRVHLQVSVRFLATCEIEDIKKSC
jgi:hypothetical protein